MRGGEGVPSKRHLGSDPYLGVLDVICSVPWPVEGDDITIECELIASTPIEDGMRFAMREVAPILVQCSKLRVAKALPI